MSLEQAKQGLSRLFLEKSLSDLVRGIRNNKKNETKYISTCIQEIKEELKSGIMEKKTVAVQKLTYVCASSTLYIFLFSFFLSFFLSSFVLLKFGKIYN